jgi:hypothetical protein
MLPHLQLLAVCSCFFPLNGVIPSTMSSYSLPIDLTVFQPQALVICLKIPSNFLFINRYSYSFRSQSHISIIAFLAYPSHHQHFCMGSSCKIIPTWPLTNMPLAHVRMVHCVIHLGVAANFCDPPSPCFHFFGFQQHPMMKSQSHNFPNSFHHGLFVRFFLILQIRLLFF